MVFDIKDKSKGEHVHSYFPLQTNNTIRTVYEPTEQIDENDLDRQLYRAVEYMYMFCKCGESIISKIKKKNV